MKGKSKQQKGITLIALIITIVVLLILAVVAIDAIQDDGGILAHAQNAAGTYNNAVANEQAALDKYLEYLNGGKLWTQSKTTVTRENQKLNVGDEVKLKVDGDADYIKYSAGDYAGKWVVLGVENGKLLLVSANEVKGNVVLYGKDGGTEYEAGYNNGVAYLNGLCQDYLDTKYAAEVRCMKAEDVYRLVDYVPTTGDSHTFTSDLEHPTKGIASATNPITITNTVVDVDFNSISSLPFIACQPFLSATTFESFRFLENQEWPDGVYTYYTCAFGFVELGDWSINQDRICIDYFGKTNTNSEHSTDEGYNGIRAVVALKSNVSVEKVQ